MYEEVVDEKHELITVKYTSEIGQVWFIPQDEANRMYSAYLQWKLTQEVNPDQTA